MEIAGLKVVDATKPLKITISKADVAKGDTKDPGACAAARAAVRSGECTEARVHIGRTYLKVKTPSGRAAWRRYLTPKSLRTEIVAFDRGATFAPGEYTLVPLPPATRKARGTAHGSDTNKNNHRPKIARIKHHKVSGVRHGLLR